MSDSVPQPDRELALDRLLIFLAAVVIPVFGPITDVAGPGEYDPMWARLGFAVGCSLWLIGSYLWAPIERATRPFTWVLATSFSLWYTWLCTVNDYSWTRVVGILLIQFLCGLSLRSASYTASYHVVLLAATAAGLLAVGDPVVPSVFVLACIGSMGLFSIAVVFNRARTLSALAARTAELEIARTELELRVEDRTRALTKSLATLESEVAVRREAEERARAANVAKSSFLANMSHELRTPLNAILGYAELMREEAVDEQRPGSVADLDRILGAGEHLLSMIRDVLDLAKIEAGRVELHPSPVDLAAVVSTVVNAVAPQMAANHNQLELDLPDELPPIWTDEKRLAQILVNLTGNAAKFTDAGRVGVRVRRVAGPQQPTLCVEVWDTGCGIPREELPLVFDKFTQLGAEQKRDGQGTGLGLAICRELCAMLDGAMSVRSTVGEGSTFSVHLPWLDPPAAASPQTREAS